MRRRKLRRADVPSQSGRGRNTHGSGRKVKTRSNKSRRAQGQCTGQARRSRVASERANAKREAEGLDTSEPAWRTVDRKERSRRRAQRRERHPLPEKEDSHEVDPYENPGKWAEADEVHEDHNDHNDDDDELSASNSDGEVVDGNISETESQYSDGDVEEGGWGVLIVLHLINCHQLILISHCWHRRARRRRGRQRWRCKWWGATLRRWKAIRLDFATWSHLIWRW